MPPVAPTSDPSPAPPRSRWLHALLLALLVVTCALRVWDAAQVPRSGRYFDERYSTANLRRLLVHGELRPANAYYPSLSYLPQAAVLAASEGLHRLTGWPALAIRGRTPDGWSAHAYRLARFTSVAWALLSLLLLHRVGSRLFSPAVGLLAAAVLASFPRHVISSTQFKPDVLITLLLLLTFDWTLSAAWRPSLGRFLRVGVGVGLTTASKYTGAFAALALVVAVAARWRDRRQWGWLLLAGATSLLTFVALDPWLDLVRRDLGFQVRGYAARGAQEGSDHWVVLWREGQFLLVHHGWVVTAFLLVGLAGMLWRLARAPRQGATSQGVEAGWSEPQRLGVMLVLGQLLGYAALHATGVSLFRGQNFLPVVPFTSLVAAWGAVETTRWVAGRLPALLSPAVGRAAIAVAVGLLLARQGNYVYGRVVPTNWQLAAALLQGELAPLAGRHVLYGPSPAAPPLRLADRAQRAIVTAVAEPASVPAATRWLADAELMLRLGGGGGGAPSPPPARRGEELRIFTPRPFASRGATVTLRVHPWVPAGQPRRLAASAPGARRLVASLPPALAAGEVVSLAVWHPRDAAAPEALTLDGESLPLVEVDRVRGQVCRATSRVRLASPAANVEVTLPAGARARYRLELRRWNEPGSQPRRPVTP